MKIIAKNRKAYFNYEVISKYEAGIVLTGSEIKAIRTNNVSLQDSYVVINNTNPYIVNMNIGNYKFTNDYVLDPKRKRKLLLHQKEISKLANEQKLKNLYVIPLTLYLNNRSLAKIEIGLARSKKLYDKRQALKEKEQKRKVKKYF